MNKIGILIFTLTFSLSSVYADIDCPADSAYHVDMRTMLPDGSPNPSYGQQISTGLCACVTFNDGIEVNGNEITFTINIIDNEPIRGIELDVHHDFADLTYESVSRGDKLQGLVNDEGNPTSDMTILGNSIDSHVKILAYSVNRARTSGDGEEGSLLYLTYTLADGVTLPDNVSFHFSVINIPGTSLNPELLNVVCSFPDEDNPIAVSTVTASSDDNLMLPEAFALFQNYPNPFNPSTQIEFSLPEASLVRLEVFNTLGQRVQTLKNEKMPAGNYSVTFEAFDLTTGIYLYRLTAGEFSQINRMLLIK